MLPIIDYGSIAIVIPKVAAVGGILDDGNFGFEVYLTGMEDPVIISFENSEEAMEAREELIAIIAQYHYIKELGPDFDLDDLANMFEQDNKTITKKNKNKHKHKQSH